MSNYQDNGNGAVATGNGEVGGDAAQGTAGIPGKDDDKKLFVGALSRQTTDKELTEYFSKFGAVESVTVKVDPFTGQSRGFAFVVFSDSCSLDACLLAGDHFISKRKVDPKRVSGKFQQGKIFVGGLAAGTTDDQIRDHFSQYGTVVDVQTPYDKIKQQRKGFSFVTFDSKSVTFKVLQSPKQLINGKEVDVKKIKLQPFQQTRFGWDAGTMGNQPYGNFVNYDGSYGVPYDCYGGYGDGSCDPYYANYLPPDFGNGRPRGGFLRQRHQPY